MMHYKKVYIFTKIQAITLSLRIQNEYKQHNLRIYIDIGIVNHEYFFHTTNVDFFTYQNTIDI